jgi:hypothetical protein
MKNGLFKRLLPHLIAVIVFLVVAMIYCKPVIEGMVLEQTDNVQWKAMAKNSFNYKEKHGNFPLWTNGMFSGMPGYQIAMSSKVKITPNAIYGIYDSLLPKPINFFFLAAICFYFLTQVLRINPYIGIIGGLAYAYVTYHPVIIAVGHDTKMQSLALIPAFIASLILIYERKYLLGAALLAIFTGFLVGINHMQIVYYSFMIALFMSVGYAVHWIKQKNYKHMLLAAAFALGAGAVGLLVNSVSILTTYEASKTSIRGGTDLQDQNSTKTGLSKDYALSYSMYKSEPFVMMVPKMYGGSNDFMEMKQDKSKTVEVFQTLPQQLQQAVGSMYLAQNEDGDIYPRRTYWGGIGSTSGPPYVGAIICFLALIGFFILDSKHKWWILTASALAIVMSWGSYFESFNVFLLKTLPMYNKFRAPSMMIVIPTFLLCMLAVLTLQKIISYQDKKELWQRYRKGLMLTGGVFVLLLLIYFSADFSSDIDKRVSENFSRYGQQVMDYVNKMTSALKEDRKDLFFGSLIRSFLFIAAAAFILWLYIRKNIKPWIAIAVVGLLAFIDVIAIDTTYLSSRNFKEEAAYQNNFSPSYSDSKIMHDTSFYRVYDLRNGPFNSFNGGALAAYFHNLVGGYHPAKLSIYQDLIEHQFYKDNIDQQLLAAPGSLPVANMLNAKYIILPDQQKGDTAILNPSALGPAWFVKNVKFENDPTTVMNALTNFNPADTAVLFAKDQQLASNIRARDSSDNIQLIANDNDEVVYKYSSSGNRFAVFSEVFYDHGWKATVDGKELPIIRTNYVLRGLVLPAGQNKEIRFAFHPSSFYTGEKLAMIGGIISWLLLLGAIFMEWRRKKMPVKNA